MIFIKLDILIGEKNICRVLQCSIRDRYLIFLSSFNLDGFLELWTTPRIITSLPVILYIISQERQTARRYIFVLVGISSHSLKEKGFREILSIVLKIVSPTL